MTTNIQDALSNIMEVCETKMSENDYLIVTGLLKIVYDENTKNFNKVVKMNQILVTEQLLANPNTTFELTNDEKKSIMNNRLKLQFKGIVENIESNIRDVSEDIAEVTRFKKEAWNWVKTMRYSYSPDRENSVYEHKKIVQREKELKLELKDLKKEMEYITKMLE
jgi:ABC-type uncharacterized transport system substrate-binding protein